MRNKLFSVISTVIVVAGLSACAENTAAPGNLANQNSVKNSSSMALLDNTQQSAAPAASVSAVALGTSLAADGAVSKPTTVFAPNTKNIYAVLSLENATARTQISYIRYYDGKYVDSEVSHPSKDGVEYFHFEWILKDGKSLKAGNYSLDFYVNGKKAQTVSYTVK